MFFWMVVALIVAVAIAVTPAGQIAIIKLRDYAYGVKFMIKSNDLPSQPRGTKFIRMPNVGPYADGTRTLRIVFVRHGESVWNSLFNSFGLGWPMRALRALFRESSDFFFNPFDSVIIDSPLSVKGRKQAQELAAFFKRAKGKVSFDTASSVVVSSNLRRAMDTALIGVGPRLAETKERIVVSSALQEGSRNIDAQSFSTEPGRIAPMQVGDITDPRQLSTVFNPYLNEGNKVIGVDVYARMEKFVLQIFGAYQKGTLVPADPSVSNNAELREIIVVGHSGYFRNFFRRFLPDSSQHVAKKKKMQNCAVVAFDLTRTESSNAIVIDEASITALFKGFK